MVKTTSLSPSPSPHALTPLMLLLVGFMLQIYNRNYIGVVDAAAAAAAAAAASAAGGGIDPLYATNITVYHVNQLDFPSAPINMNTASLRGDMYFDLRSRGLPLECGPWKNQSFWSRLDCVNAEVDTPADKLGITKLVLEVDSRFGTYSDCNVLNGTYFCTCDGNANCSAITPAHAPNGNAPLLCNMSSGCMWDERADTCQHYGCENITSEDYCHHTYHPCAWNSTTHSCHHAGPPLPSCNPHRVGRLDLSNVTWGAGHAHSTIDYWHLNTLLKMQGVWYDTPATAQCDETRPEKPCAWRVAQAVKRVRKNCSDAAIATAVTRAGQECFNANCNPMDRRNSSSQCYIECLYKTILGPNAGRAQIQPGDGMPIADLERAWDAPFANSDPAQGGCPNLLP